MDSTQQTRRRAVKLLRWGCVLALSCLVLKCTFLPGTAFDPALWRDGEPPGVRAAMADRLVATRALIGKGRSEVVQMLGETQTHLEFKDWDLIYHLGPERCLFMRLGSEFLLIRLSSEGTARECRIMSDG